MRGWRLWTIVAVVLVSVVSGCGKEPNPLIGQWKLALADKEKMKVCTALASLEFTEKTVTTGRGAEKSTVTVAYGRDGDSYLATAGNGQAYRVKVESGGIEANGCHLIPASDKSSPIIGVWTPVGQDPWCNDVEKMEFTEDAMTVTSTSPATPKVSFPVSYSRDGVYVVATPTSLTGKAVKVMTEVSGIHVYPADGSQGHCHLFPAAPSAGTVPAQGANAASPKKSEIDTTGFAGKWYPASSKDCDSNVFALELAPSSKVVTVKVGFNGQTVSHSTDVTYSRDGEFYVATPTVESGLPLKFKLNSPNIILDSGCVLIPAK